MGRQIISRGGLTSKFPALVDAEGYPVGLRLIGVQVVELHRELTRVGVGYVLLR